MKRREFITLLGGAAAADSARELVRPAKLASPILWPRRKILATRRAVF